jgi:hypothetical protein
MKYIRTRDDALDAAAEILDLPDRKDQLIQSTVRIMLCLDVEPRDFLCDCQALLIQGGLDALAERRREALVAADEVMIVDPEEDRLFDSVGKALDALRFSDVLRQVFPETRHERWQVARTLLGRERELRDLVATAIRARGNAGAIAAARQKVEAAFAAERPAWIDRAGGLLSLCRDALRSAGTSDADTLRDEGTLLFELAATDDARAVEIFKAMDVDPLRAYPLVLRLREIAEAVRALNLDEGGGAESAGAKDVA